MEGRFEEARDFRERARAIYEDLGMRLQLAGSMQLFGYVDLLAGDPRAAEAEFRAGYEISERMGETGYLSTMACMLGESLYAQARYEEALRFSEIGEERAAPDDVMSQIMWRALRAKMLARRGQPKSAESLAREAVALAEPTDWTDTHADALMALAEVRRLTEQMEGVREAAEEALRLYERKGNLVSAKRARALLAELRS